MRYFLAAFAASAALLVTPVMAAGNAPSFDNGPVWDYTQIRTKDGYFNDYMNWLATTWKVQEEALKKAGVIVDYKVYVVDHPRQNEPDILLGQEYKNMAAFDVPVAKQYEIQAKVTGSIAKSDQEQAARGTIRTIQDNVLVREVTLK